MKTWLKGELETTNIRVARWQLERFRTAHTRELMILKNVEGKRDALEQVFWVTKRTRKSSLDYWLTMELAYSENEVIKNLKAFSETRDTADKAVVNYAIGYKDGITKILQHLKEREN